MNKFFHVILENEILAKDGLYLHCTGDQNKQESSRIHFVTKKVYEK